MSTDIDFSYEETDFGGLTAAEVMARGHAHNIISDNLVEHALNRVIKTGIIERLATWRAEDYPEIGLGGRPALVTDRAILVGLVLLAQEHSPLWIRSLAELFHFRLTAEARVLLGIPATSASFGAAQVEQKRWYNNAYNAFHRMLALMDPYPVERRYAREYWEIRALLNAHDETLEIAKKARLDEFMNAFLHMTFMEQPRRLRRATKNIDLSIDQTFIQPPTRKGFAPKTLDERIITESQTPHRERTPGPVDPFAGWYKLTGDRPDLRRGAANTVGPEKGKKSNEGLAWGWVANIAVRVDSESPREARFPKLAVSATMSMPGFEGAEEAVSLMRAALRTDLAPGIVDGDKAYFANALVKRLHKPTMDLGFTPSTDYRVDRLGVQGQVGGAQLIEGKFHCPGTPQALKDATKDRVNDIIDEATYRQRREERLHFELRPKEKPDAKGRTPMMCPALGDSPTVTCPLRELSRKAVDKARPRVADDDVPEFMDKICRQHSVSFAKEDGLRQKQAFPYKSKEWEQFHRHARNSIESLNAGIKEPGMESIETASRRRVRGFAAAQVFVTVLLANYNLRKIAAFMSNELENSTTTPGPARGPIIRRRDGEWHNPYTGTYPPDIQHPIPQPDPAAPVPLRT